MHRLWILLIPVASPFALLLGWYLVEVVPALAEPVYGSRTLFERWHWASRHWWYGHFSHSSYYGGYGSSEFLLVVCVLAFLVGCIVALMLHLFLPRRSASGQQSEDR